MVGFRKRIPQVFGVRGKIFKVLGFIGQSLRILRLMVGLLGFWSWEMTLVVLWFLGSPDSFVFAGGWRQR